MTSIKRSALLLTPTLCASAVMLPQAAYAWVTIPAITSTAVTTTAVSESAPKTDLQPELEVTLASHSREDEAFRSSETLQLSGIFSFQATKLSLAHYSSAHFDHYAISTDYAFDYRPGLTLQARGEAGYSTRETPGGVREHVTNKLLGSSARLRIRYHPALVLAGDFAVAVNEQIVRLQTATSAEYKLRPGLQLSTEVGIDNIRRPLDSLHLDIETDFTPAKMWNARAGFRYVPTPGMASSGFLRSETELVSDISLIAEIRWKLYDDRPATSQSTIGTRFAF